MARYLSAHQVLTLAEIVTAVHEGRRVRTLGDTPDGITEGTLRGFTPQGSGAHFSGGDIRDASIRITTKQGGDVWVSVVEAMVLRGDGAFAF